MEVWRSPSMCWLVDGNFHMMWWRWTSKTCFRLDCSVSGILAPEDDFLKSWQSSRNELRDYKRSCILHSTSRDLRRVASIFCPKKSMTYTVLAGIHHVLKSASPLLFAASSLLCYAMHAWTKSSMTLRFAKHMVYAWAETSIDDTQKVGELLPSHKRAKTSKWKSIRVWP